MGNGLRSIDDMLRLSSSKGHLVRMLQLSQPNSTTAATTNSGYTTVQRYPQTFTVPTLGTGVTGAYLCNFITHVYTSGSAIMACLEVDMGTLTVATNAFTDGSAMPTRLIHGAGSTEIATASMMPVLTCRTGAAGMSGASVTITYTNGEGTTGRTATLSWGATNPVANTGFLIAPHLQAGDTSIKDVTGISCSAGTAGEFRVTGLIPLDMCIDAGTTGFSTTAPTFSMPNLRPRMIAGDVIAFYKFGTTASGLNTYVILGLTADD